MEKEQYFQSITRFFLRLRGAPFFMSAQELSLIESWAKIPIPVPEVLAGISTAYQNYRTKPGKKPRIFSLTFCRREVEQAYKAYQDRRTGRNQRKITAANKYRHVLLAVQDFLKHLSPAVKFLEPVFINLAARLEARDIEEAELEEAEGNIEELVFRHTADNEIERIKTELQRSYGILGKKELAQMLKIKLLKEFRDRHKIPYVSLFYY